MTAIRVVLARGGSPESVHRVTAVFHDLASGRDRSFGDPGVTAFWRSSMKPFQALPIVSDGALDRLGLGPEALALACASHHGTPRHVEIVESVLAALGLDPDALACGPHRPVDPEAARALDETARLPGKVHNNCSGKHAAMLALTAVNDWPAEGYQEPDHPLQRRIRAQLSEWLDSDPEDLPWGVDGCGVPTPALRLEEMAVAYARLGAARDASPRAVVSAMTTHPTLVSGLTALSANVMEATGGRILAKEGAEGVFCLSGLEAGWGAAFKVTDGAMRALGPAVVHVLTELGLLRPEEVERLSAFGRPTIENTLGGEVATLAVATDGG